MASEVIAAISTPPGRGGIGVIRISGPRLGGMLDALVGKEVKPRQATRADFCDADGALIDQGLALYFPQPHSYTGEDVIELQAHGGPVVQQLLLQRCVELGARLAEPGEFTKRAFLNGKLDLTQAEGVADLIDASTAAAARCAARSLQGDFSRRIAAMVESLVELRMLIEATLDFPDDGVDTLEHYDGRAKLDRVREQIEQVLIAARQGSILRAGIQVVIAGQPNVGKSSLLNRLAGDEVAIVAATPGTTRDAIREDVNVDGVALRLVDTAGLRESADLVENIGISRTWTAIDSADLVIWVGDAPRPETHTPRRADRARLPAGTAVIYALNKADLLASVPDNGSSGPFFISAATGYGLDRLKQAMLAAIGWEGQGDGLLMAREHHLQALLSAQKLLRDADVDRPELLAEHLRLAQRELGAITGEFTADDLLGRIFARFCIGK